MSTTSHGASMIEKSKRKKKIDDEHSRNYDAGAVDVDERQLRRTGVRGRKIYVLIFLLMVLLLLFFANLVILIVIFYVDNINHTGMESISFYKDGKTKWHQDTDLKFVYPLDGVLGGFDNENIEINGDGQKVFIQGGPSTNEYPSVAVGPDGTDIKIKKSFTFTDPFAAKKVLHLDHNSILKKEGRFVGDTLKTNSIRTPRIISDDNQDVRFSGKEINVTGSEGVYMDSKSFLLQTDRDIGISVKYAKSGYKGLIVVSLGGIRKFPWYMAHLNQPIALQVLKMGPSIEFSRSKLEDTSDRDQKLLNAHRYRLCACANNGRLFKARIVDGKSSSCSSASKNPCA